MLFAKGLAAVTALLDFIDEPKHGKYGALVALGCAAKTGLAWTQVG